MGRNSFSYDILHFSDNFNNSNILLSTIKKEEVSFGVNICSLRTNEEISVTLTKKKKTFLNLALICNRKYEFVKVLKSGRK